jgi:hypothetical protein
MMIAPTAALIRVKGNKTRKLYKVSPNNGERKLRVETAQ